MWGSRIWPSCVTCKAVGRRRRRRRREGELPENPTLKIRAYDHGFTFHDNPEIQGLTLDPLHEFVQALRDCCTVGLLKYLVVQFERGDETGSLHLQGFIMKDEVYSGITLCGYLERAQRELARPDPHDRAWWKRLLRTCHFYKRRGLPGELSRYCKKVGVTMGKPSIAYFILTPPGGHPC